jgi:hypothetical protein
MSTIQDCNKSEIEHQFQLLTHEVSQRAQRFNRELVSVNHLFRDKQNVMESHDDFPEKIHPCCHNEDCDATGMQRVVARPADQSETDYGDVVRRVRAPWDALHAYIHDLMHPEGTACSKLLAGRCGSSGDQEFEIIVLGVELDHHKPCCDTPVVELPSPFNQYITGVTVRALVRHEELPTQHLHDYSSKSSSSSTPPGN